MSVLPPPTDAWAILVGLENYERLGEGFHLRGAAGDALRVAAWLLRIGLPADHINIRLAPAAGFDVQARLIAEGLTPCGYKDFSRDDFDSWFTTTLMNTPGSLLFVYWSGHGLVNHRNDQLHLLLPEADAQQLRSFDATNLLQVLQGNTHAHFCRQIVIVDTCRSWLSEWSAVAEPSVLRLNPAAPNAGRRVQQLVMFACAMGQVTGLKQEEGSLFTATLLEEFHEPIAGAWPNFEMAFGRASERVREDTGGAQSPVFWKGQDWDGNRITGGGFMSPGLAEIMSRLGWTTQNFRTHYSKSIPDGAPRAAASDLDAMLAYLTDLPTHQGVSPLVAFVERVARESRDAQLDQWLKTIPTPNERAEVAAHLEKEAKTPRRMHLILWYQEDAAGAVMQAEIAGADGVLVNTGWAGPPRKALAVSPDTIAVTIGKWIDEAYAILSDVELVIELCLPRFLLCGEHDLAEVLVTAGTEKAQLGKDHTVLLRCTDRFKGRMKLRIWKEEAPGILNRLGLTVRPLEWVHHGDSPDDIVRKFSGSNNDSPVWLASVDSPSLTRDNADPVDMAIDNGLPALCWPRKGLSEAEKDDVEKKLEQLVHHLSTEFPGKVRVWRKTNWGTNAGRVALLWDDPERLPPMVQQLTQGGG